MIIAEEEIQKAVEVFFKNKPVNKVWLFGSYARGEANEESDIDVLVSIDTNAKVGMRYFLWNEDLSQLLNKKIDIVSFGWENKYLKPFIDRDKKLIYERNDK